MARGAGQAGWKSEAGDGESGREWDAGGVAACEDEQGLTCALASHRAVEGASRHDSAVCTLQQKKGSQASLSWQRVGKCVIA